MQTVRVLVCIMAIIGFGAAERSYAHSFPSKAPLLKASLVQAYPACITPDVTTSGGRPACSGSAELDTSCLFGSKASGALSATISKSNIRAKLTLKGLDPGCEGRVLAPAFTVRTTTDDCPNDHCTVVDYEVSAPGCTVKKGKCALTTSIPTGYPAGAGSEMTVLSCGVKDGDTTAFTCGIMVK